MPNININSPVADALNKLQDVSMSIWRDRQRVIESNKTKRLHYGANLMSEATKNLNLMSTPEQFENSLDVLESFKSNKFLGDTAKFAATTVEAIQDLAEKRIEVKDKYNLFFEKSREAGGQWATDDMGQMLSDAMNMDFSNLDYVTVQEQKSIGNMMSDITAELKTKTILSNLFPEHAEWRASGKKERPEGMNERLYNSMVEADAFIEAGQYNYAVAELYQYDETKAQIMAGEIRGDKISDDYATKTVKDFKTIADQMVYPDSGKKGWGTDKNALKAEAVFDTINTTDVTGLQIKQLKIGLEDVFVGMFKQLKGVEGGDHPNRPGAKGENLQAFINWLNVKENDPLLKGFEGSLRDNEKVRISKERIGRLDWNALPGFSGHGKERDDNLFLMLKANSLLLARYSQLFQQTGKEPDELMGSGVSEGGSFIDKTIKVGKFAHKYLFPDDEAAQQIDDVMDRLNEIPGDVLNWSLGNK